MPVPDAPEHANLDEVPAFLRDRPAAAPPSPVRSVGFQPVAPAIPDAASLPMAGIAPRRLVLIGAAVVLAWIVISFSRQVAEASAASTRADELRAVNSALAGEVAGLERELQTIQEERYIGQAARAFRLGTAREIPFALQVNAPPLAVDAPGSAATRVGATRDRGTPLETWLSLLFGPSD